MSRLDGRLANANANPAAMVALAWLASRLWLAIFAYAGHFSRGATPLEINSWAGVGSAWLNVWTTYDSKYFLSIAARGYTPETSVFFPLYPLLLRPFGPNINAMALAGVVISNLAFVVALWLFYEATRREYDERIARVAVWVLALFPCVVFSGAVYTESVWLALGLASWSSARRGNWAWAGAWGLGAALTRNAGPVLALALLVMWWQSEKREKSGALWALLPGLAFVGMQFYFRARLGETLSSVTNQTQFGRTLMFPLLPLWLEFKSIVMLQRLDIVTLLNFGGTLAAFGLTWKHRRVQPRADAVLLCGVLVLNLLVARVWATYTSSTLRYLFGLWPFSQLLALEVAAIPARNRAVLVGFALFLVACLSFIFGAKQFLG